MRTISALFTCIGILTVSVANAFGQPSQARYLLQTDLWSSDTEIVGTIEDVWADDQQHVYVTAEIKGKFCAPYTPPCFARFGIEKITFQMRQITQVSLSTKELGQPLPDSVEDVFSLWSLIGKNALGSQGEGVGKVFDLVFDDSNGTLLGFLIELRKEYPWWPDDYKYVLARPADLSVTQEGGEDTLRVKMTEAALWNLRSAFR